MSYTTLYCPVITVVRKMGYYPNRRLAKKIAHLLTEFAGRDLYLFTTEVGIKSVVNKVTDVLSGCHTPDRVWVSTKADALCALGGQAPGHKDLDNAYVDVMLSEAFALAEQFAAWYSVDGEDRDDIDVHMPNLAFVNDNGSLLVFVSSYVKMDDEQGDSGSN